MAVKNVFELPFNVTSDTANLWAEFKETGNPIAYVKFCRAREKAFAKINNKVQDNGMEM